MLQELQTDLTMADLKIDSYFHTKTNKQIFHIIDFEQYKKISIL
jgi:hypothetical protein